MVLWYWDQGIGVTWCMSWVARSGGDRREVGRLVVGIADIVLQHWLECGTHDMRLTQQLLVERIPLR